MILCGRVEWQESLSFVNKRDTTNDDEYGSFW